MNAAAIIEDPEVFLAIDDLELVGRGLADAVWHGEHASVLRGAGVEFHSHRAYQAGDDLRRVNWALFARHRKLFTRESRAESQRPVYLMLDATASMGVHHGPWSKLHFAKRVLAGAAHLARRQGDAPGLRTLCSESIELPPRSGADHVTGLCAAMAQCEARGAGLVAEQMLGAHARQRGFVLFVSDFLDDEERVIAELGVLRARGHDVFALQVLDPMEVELPKSGDFDFIEPETCMRMRTSMEPVHQAYARRVAEWRKGLEKMAEARDICWFSMTTRGSLVAALHAWLRADQGTSTQPRSLMPTTEFLPSSVPPPPGLR